MRYPDGVTLRITSIRQGHTSGQGPGIITGPVTTFHLLFANNSGRTINLDQVVPTATFGKPARIARPVYDQKTQDFGTAVKPGATERATYAFSIPVSELSDVTIYMDFDGRHVAAQFHGEASS